MDLSSLNEIEFADFMQVTYAKTGDHKMISNASFRVEINRTTHDGQADFSQGCAPCIGAGEGHDRFYPGEFAELVHQAAGVLDIIEEADCDDVIEGLLRFETHDVNAFEAAFIGQFFLLCQ